MLIACSSCHRQYDVSHLGTGDHLRCLCGELTTVPEQRSHVAKVHHCSACGASIEDGATRCEYCKGAISLEERKLGDSCPQCFARLMKDASFCMECGVKIEPTTMRAKELENACPRCENDLYEVTGPQGHYTECRSCGGLWLRSDFFDKVVETKDLSPIGKVPCATEIVADLKRHEVRYLKCPVCSQMMNRKNFGRVSGIIIDGCREHGYWFDNRELAKILQFVEAGGLDKMREREIAEAKCQLERAQDRTRDARSGSAVPVGRYGRASSDFEVDVLGDILGMLGRALYRLFRN